jgi:hypothetical protein
MMTPRNSRGATWRIYKVKGNGKIFPVHSMKAFGARRMALSLLNIGSRWRWGLRFTLLGKGTFYPLNRRLGESKSRSGRFGEENDLLPLPAIEPRFFLRPCCSLRLYIYRPHDYTFKTLHFFPMARQPLAGLDRLIFRGFTISLFKHTTLGRTPLGEWSARRRDLFLTTHNTHKRQTSMP